MLCTCCITLFGCANNGFEPVCSIEYTTNGTKTTEDSRWEIHYSAPRYITKEEYDASPTKQRITGQASSGKISQSHKIPSNAKGKTAYVVNAEKTNSDNLKRYYYGHNTIGNITQYFEVTMMYTTYYYIYVKVVNSTTIIIRNNKGDTTYTVSSYRITKFN